MQVLTLLSFDDWLSDLRDNRAQARILQRINRLRAGNPGDHRGVGSGVLELRMTMALATASTIVQRGSTLVILLCGGDKNTQNRDIERAKKLAAALDEEA